MVGAAVCKWRMARGYTQEQLAAKCQIKGWDISRATLSKIEARIRCVSDAEVMLLASVLKCSHADLLGADLKEALEVAQTSRPSELKKVSRRTRK